MDEKQVNVTGFKLPDQLLKKLSIIASCHNRYRNKEMEWALTQYVNIYERMYGDILAADGDVLEKTVEAIRKQDKDLYDCIEEMADEDFRAMLSREQDIYDSIEEIED
jgi:predicted transcriptional regulator